MSIFSFLKKKQEKNAGAAPKPSVSEAFEAVKSAYGTAGTRNNGGGAKSDHIHALKVVHFAMKEGFEGAEDVWLRILESIALDDPDLKVWSKRLSAADYKKLLELESNRAFKAGDYQKALPLLINRAKGGDLEAAYLVGACYFEGFGTEVNLDEAIRWSEAAAEQGHRRAIIYTMGGYFARRTAPGNPDPKGDLKRSADWAQRLLQYTDATEDESASANIVLRRCRLDGKREEALKLLHTDWKESVKLLEENAGEGDLLSMFSLGFFYGSEDKSQPWTDYGKSAFWYRKAAERGDKESFLPLAKVLYKTADYEEALHWAEKAKEAETDEDAAAVCSFIRLKLRRIQSADA